MNDMMKHYDAAFHSKKARRRLSFKRKIRTLAIHFTLAVMAFLHANIAVAIVADPHPLVPADHQAFQDASPLIGNNETVSMDNLFISRFGIMDDRFLIAQVRNEKCASDKCPTYFISYTGESRRIILAAYLPAKMTVSDLIKNDCAGCDRIYTLMFEDSAGAGYFFGVTNSYAVMFDRSLRDYTK